MCSIQKAVFYICKEATTDYTSSVPENQTVHQLIAGIQRTKQYTRTADRTLTQNRTRTQSDETMKNALTVTV